MLIFVGNGVPGHLLEVAREVIRGSVIGDENDFGHLATFVNLSIKSFIENPSEQPTWRSPVCSEVKAYELTVLSNAFVESSERDQLDLSILVNQ